MRGIGTWLRKILPLALCLLLFCGGTVVMPAVAEAGLIGQEEEIRLGKAAAEQIEARYGLVRDPSVTDRVERIGQSLAAVSGRKDLKYTFKVLNTEDVNALACPGGYIFVFKGLLDYMPSDAELAGVLGHEIGHVVHRHTVKQIEQNMWTGLAAMIAGIASGRGDMIAAATVVSDALMAGYSRADESEADRSGFQYTVKAGYSPYAMVVTLGKLHDMAEEYGNPGYGLFSTHPEPEERLKKIGRLMDRLKGLPTVETGEDGSATVVDGTWRYTVKEPAGETSATYRADLLAGSLYMVRQRGKIYPERFIVYDRGDEAVIYYDDLELLIVYPRDAGGRQVGRYANGQAAIFRKWAEGVNAGEIPGVVKTVKKTETEEAAAVKSAKPGKNAGKAVSKAEEAKKDVKAAKVTKNADVAEKSVSAARDREEKRRQEPWRTR